MTVTATPVTTPPSSTGGSTSTPAPATTPGIADNFQTFLTLLTTQLQNQNPLDPLDTNQFTSQLVQFASVEQQLKTNDQLTTLVNLQQATQSTQALAFVGQTVTLSGATAPLANSAAAWSLSAASPSSATINITNSTGQTVYTATATLGTGNSTFQWNGKGNDGTQWPDGNYTMNVTAKDNTGKAVAVTTEIEGTVDSVDLTASPPLLSVGGQNYTVSQVKRVGA
jgi:flagellar basal-body rod modification protein FlgD